MEMEHSNKGRRFLTSAGSLDDDDEWDISGPYTRSPKTWARKAQKMFECLNARMKAIAI